MDWWCFGKNDPYADHFWGKVHLIGWWFFGVEFTFFCLQCLMNFPRGVSPTAVVDQGFVPGADKGDDL